MNFRNGMLFSIFADMIGGRIGQSSTHNLIRAETEEC